MKANGSKQDMHIVKQITYAREMILIFNNNYIIQARKSSMYNPNPQ